LRAIRLIQKPQHRKLSFRQPLATKLAVQTTAAELRFSFRMAIQKTLIMLDHVNDLQAHLQGFGEPLSRNETKIVRRAVILRVLAVGRSR
jgi:hypothetical protein